MIEIMPALLGSNTYTVGKINVSVGDIVEVGQVLLQVETKKGNREIRATSSGIIKEIHVREGEEVSAKGNLFTIEDIESKKENIKSETKTNFESIKKSAELLIIGGGTGGYVAAIVASKNGKKVILIEKDEMGGTCLNRGCIPTKTLIESSLRYRNLKLAKEFGIDFNGELSIDMAKVINRKNNIVNELKNGIHFLMEKNNIEVIKGNAEFVNTAKIIVLGDKEYEISFTDCIIATGSETFKPSIDGINLTGIITSDEALNLTELPNEITIVGGGVIGLEFAFLYSNFGVKVYVIEMLERLVAGCDLDISNSILKIAKERGIEIFLGSRVKGFKKSIDGRIITEFESNDKKFIISDKVLAAIGRKPYIKGLGLDNIGIELKRSAIKVDDRMRTNVAHIYAIGDVNNRIQLAHAAAYEGMIAVSEILGKGDDFNLNKIPSVIYTSPEIGSVGITEDEAKKLNIKYKVGRFKFSSNGKALIMGEVNGYIKLIEDENGVIIGGTLIGADASSLLATIGLAVTNKLKASDVSKTIFAHPTTSEVIGEAAHDLGLGAIHE